MSLVRPSLRAFSISSALAYPRFPRLALKTTARDFPSDPRFTALDEEQPARAAASGGLINEDPELPSFLRRERGSGTGPDGSQEPETAPPAWFLPDPSSSTIPMVRRPSFLPPAPRSTFVPPTEISAPPPSMPAALEDLYYHLQGHPLFVPSSATFTSTHDPAPKTIPIPDHPPQKGKRRRGAFDAGPGIPGIDAGGAWEWVVVTTVEGQGFGDVRRAEYAIREWLSLNPISMDGIRKSDVRNKVPKPPKGSPPTDWALIDTGVGVVVHVMSREARARWSIEDIWRSSM